LFFFCWRRERVAESEFPSLVYLIKGSSSSEEGGLVERGVDGERRGSRGREGEGRGAHFLSRMLC
jgi:hypothetical protein